VEFFKNPNIDFLGKKWYFIAFSLIFSVAGVCSMLFWHGIPLDIDFRGGTQVYVKFSHPPNDNVVREAMDRVGLHNARIQRLGAVGSNEVLVDVPLEVTSQQALDVPKQKIIDALQTNAPAGKQDLNNSSVLAVSSYLEEKDPLHLATDAHQR
jgi:preprotein translocase subunit SecF